MLQCPVFPRAMQSPRKEAHLPAKEGYIDGVGAKLAKSMAFEFSLDIEPKIEAECIYTLDGLDFNRGCYVCSIFRL